MTSTRLRRDKLRFRPATLLPGCGIEQNLVYTSGNGTFRENRNQSTQDRDSVIAKMAETLQIRVVTYNIHKCRGLDRRVSPSRIAEVLHKLSADCIALQEVVRTAATAEGDQARLIAQALKEYDVVFGPNRPLGKGDYGNATLSRLPVEYSENYNLTCGRLEPRGCLRTDLRLPNGQLLHFFNVHLGTS